PDAMSCSMCKRQIINAGIDKIVIRITETEYRTIPVSDWIENDDSIFAPVVIGLAGTYVYAYWEGDEKDEKNDRFSPGTYPVLLSERGLVRRRAYGPRRRLF
ncbi:MAG: hypothetical protein K6F19_01555, partial [Oscillospiraceae bacterium]|nr:hypothetical protein [Oscillospiraceae bacterium]